MTNEWWTKQIMGIAGAVLILAGLATVVATVAAGVTS